MNHPAGMIRTRPGSPYRQSHGRAPRMVRYLRRSNALMPTGEQIGRPPRYGLLLIALIAFYLLSALSNGWAGQAGQLVLVVAVTLLALRNTDFPFRWVARWATLAGSVLAIVLVASSHSPVARGTASIWTGIMLLATVV